MIKLFLTFSILALTVNLFSQDNSAKINSSNTYPALMDKEYEQGSNIIFPEVNDRLILVLEMSHWAIANMNQGKYKTIQILSPSTHLMMMTPTFTTNKERKISIGLSWFMYSYKGTTNYEHGGSDDGYKSLLTLIPEKQIGIIILCNLEEIRMYDTRNKIRDILLAKYDKTMSK